MELVKDIIEKLKTDKKFLVKFIISAIVAMAVLVVVISLLIPSSDKGNDENGDGMGDSSENGDSSGGNGGADDTGDENTGGESSIGNGENGGSQNSGEQNDAVQIAGFMGLGGYSEGLMLVRKAANSSVLYCIDKSGDTVFTLSDIIHTFDTIPFHNGLAFIDGKLYNREGQCITAEDLGGSAIKTTGSDMQDYAMRKAFEDGYIFVERTTTSYTGSVDEMAIFDSNLEKMVDYSSELYKKLNEDYRSCYYYDGYLYTYDRYELNGKVFDLRTGNESFDIAGWCETLNPKNESDLWRCDSSSRIKIYYDERERLSRTDRETALSNVLDTSKLPSNETAGFSVRELDGEAIFIDGYAAVEITVNDSQVGSRYYFTIIDESGSLCFEPIEMRGAIKSINYDNGFFAVVTGDRWQSFPVCLELYDKNGQVGVYEPDKYSTMALYFSDGIICCQVSSRYAVKEEEIKIFDTKLQPVFEVEVINE